MPTDAPECFDYVIVGAGAAGSVLANRLTEDPDVTVCVLEAGPPDRNPWIHIPAGFTKTLFDPGVTWQFKTEPTENTGGRPIATTQGRTLGGSSSINGMIYNRGQPADLDSWAQRGNRGWGYADVLPVLPEDGAPDRARRGRKARPRGRPSGHRHGLGPPGLGGVHRRLRRPRDSAQPGLQQRRPSRRRLLPAHDPQGSPGQRGGGVPAPGARPRPGRPADERARERIVFEGKRAVGIRYLAERGGAARQVRARREVILSAGTVNTARLLQISGVGPAGLLGELGVPVVHELAGVGENFRDHYAARVVMRAAPGTVDAERALARAAARPADPPLGDGPSEHSRAGAVAGARVLAFVGGRGRAGSAVRVHARQLSAGQDLHPGRLPRHDRRRLAAPAGEQGLRARAQHRPVRRSGDPAELPLRSGATARSC